MSAILQRYLDLIDDAPATRPQPPQAPAATRLAVWYLAALLVLPWLPLLAELLIGGPHAR
jgi:hypothetical protein